MPSDATQRAIHRVRILKGLIDKFEDSIRDEEYCVDLLKQSIAIQRALKSLDAHLLNKHIDSCIKSHMTKGKRSDILRDELRNIYELSRK